MYLAGQILGLRLRSVRTFRHLSPTCPDTIRLCSSGYCTSRDAIVMAIFSINCTLPPHDTTFVQPPNARGTLDIVYSCLAVIVLCTWSILHLNVPVQVTTAGWRQKLMRSLVRTLTKVGWMVFNVMAPEWPFAQALCGLLSQRRLQKKFDRYTECDQVPWTGSHTQLANMGGFVVRFDRTLLRPDRVAEQQEDTQCVVDKYCCNRRSVVDTVGMLHLADWRRRSQRYQSAEPPDIGGPPSLGWESTTTS
jgi:hypothetical protein